MRRADGSTKIISGLALTIRLLVAFSVWHAKPAAWFYSQASELGELANSVASGHGLASPFGGATGASAFLPPGYPLFVGLLFRVFGAYSRGAELTLLIAQACFGAVAVLLLVLIARQLLGRTITIVTGFILAIHPWLIALGIVFWETSLSLMILMLLVWLSVLWLRRPSSSIAFALSLGVFVGISVNASLTLVCIGLCGWSLLRRRESIRLAVLPGVLTICLCALWPLRNLSQMHAFVPSRDNFGYELWQGNRTGSNGFFSPELHPNSNRAEFKQFQHLGELGYMSEKSHIARAAIVDNPKRFLFLTLKRIVCFWLGINRQTYPNQIFVASVSSVLGLIGLGLYVRKKGLALAAPVLIPLLFFPLPYYVTHPDFRFWCLLSPLLTGLAVYLFANVSSQEEASST